jgi:hypothetical protein
MAEPFSLGPLPLYLNHVAYPSAGFIAPWLPTKDTPPSDGIVAARD